MARSRSAPMLLPVLALALLLLAWLQRRREQQKGAAGPAPGYSAETGSLRNLTTGEQFDTGSIEAEIVTIWANTLGTSITWMYRNLDQVEDWAYASGAPDDWSARGWPTACGPSDDPRRYCAGFPWGSDDI